MSVFFTLNKTLDKINQNPFYQSIIKNRFVGVLLKSLLHFSKNLL
jgi:hypothetical protein